MKVRGWMMIGCAGAVAIAACSNGGSSGNDAGAEAGNDAATPNDGGGDEGTACGVTLCVHGDQPQQCPSCAPSGGDICSPPAAVTCNYTNGCSGAQLESRQCTCVLPDASAGDAGDAGDAGSGNGTAFWSCQSGA